MSITSHLRPAPGDAIGRARVEVAGLDDRLWAAVSDGDLVEVVEQIAGLRAHLAAVEAQVLVEVDSRDVAKKWLSWGRRPTGTRSPLG